MMLIKINTGMTEYPFDGDPFWKEDSEPLYLNPTSIQQMRWSNEEPQSYTTVYTSQFGCTYTTLRPEEIISLMNEETQ